VLAFARLKLAMKNSEETKVVLKKIMMMTFEVNFFLYYHSYVGWNVLFNPHNRTNLNLTEVIS
jgi:hypothetical protein